MNHTFRLIVVGALPLLVLTGCRQGTEPNAGTPSAVTQPETKEDVRELLSKTEQDWATALVKGDIAFTENLLSDDYVGTGTDGRRLTKAETIDEFRSGAFKSESMLVDRINVRVFGDTAVVTLDQSEKSQSRGKDMSGRSRWTDVFMKRNGKWQLVANHGTRVER